MSLTAFGELVVMLMAMLTVSPTPRVTWRRVDAELVESAGSVHSDSYGQELVFTKVDFSDQGTYECVAVNTESGQPRATHKTQLVVECKSYYSTTCLLCILSSLSTCFSSNHSIAYLTFLPFK